MLRKCNRKHRQLSVKIQYSTVQYRKFFNTRPVQHLVECPVIKQFKRCQRAYDDMPNIKIKIIPAPKVKRKTYIAKNEELKRALSPHLSIYKPQMSSIVSITLRMTGYSLAVMAWTVAATALLSDHNVDYFVNELKNLELKDIYWRTIRTVLAFPIAFHLVAGVRHLLFDTAKLTERKEFFVTGCIAITIALILAMCLANIHDIQTYINHAQKAAQAAKTE
ncbi:hypothetical protein DOY81_008767 [Sarcophaga bullata]|nr:hypothetical protein DOY81_008767 [Sarcophaga bullata]